MLHLAKKGGTRFFWTATTFIDGPYEPAEAPDLRIDTTQRSADQATDASVAMLFRRTANRPQTPSPPAQIEVDLR
jgi:adenylylsulfate kinase-like enzyme